VVAGVGHDENCWKIGGIPTPVVLQGLLVALFGFSDSRLRKVAAYVMANPGFFPFLSNVTSLTAAQVENTETFSPICVLADQQGFDEVVELAQENDWRCISDSFACFDLRLVVDVLVHDKDLYRLLIYLHLFCHFNHFNFFKYL